MKQRSKLKRRRNFLPTFLTALIFWSLWVGLVVRFPPESTFLHFTFYILLFLAVFLTTALVSANSRIGLTIASFVIVALLFRYFEIGNLLNLTLLTGIFLALGLYWRNN